MSQFGCHWEQKWGISEIKKNIINIVSNIEKETCLLFGFCQRLKMAEYGMFSGMMPINF